MSIKKNVHRIGHIVVVEYAFEDSFKCIIGGVRVTVPVCTCWRRAHVNCCLNTQTTVEFRVRVYRIQDQFKTRFECLKFI